MRRALRAQVEALSRPLEPRGPEPAPQLGVVEQAVERRRQRVGVAGWDEQAGLAVDDELADAADVGGDDGRPAAIASRIEIGPPSERLDKHEDVGARQQVGHVAARAASSTA